MNQTPFDRLLALRRQLSDAKIYHELASYRDDAISLLVRVPGEFWEIDFLEDGTVDIERFVSNGAIEGEAMLEELFARFSDAEPAISHETS